MTRSEGYHVRLPYSLRAAAQQLALQDGVSLEQFIVLAVAEKITALQTEARFRSERVGRGAEATGISENSITQQIHRSSREEKNSAKYEAVVRMQDASRQELALYFPHELAEEAGWRNGGEVVLRFSDRYDEVWRGIVTTKSSHTPYMRTNVFSAASGEKQRLSDLMHRSGLKAKDRVQCRIETDGTICLLTKED